MIGRSHPTRPITKLSKIGSGGVKDVFVGKLGTQRVAIEEFRGQLNTSGYQVRLSTFPESLMAPLLAVDIKLLGDFNHPNIVRFVRIPTTVFFYFPLMSCLQLGVSIPVNTKDTPITIISKLCSNGDLFDYLRGSPVPAVRRMVSR